MAMQERGEMKLAIIGVTGNVGQRLLDESLHRGHSVTGITRGSLKNSARQGLDLKVADATKPDQLAPLLRGHDVIISSLPFRGVPASVLLPAVRASGVRRLLIVGGAGSLEVSPGLTLIDSGQLPEFVIEEATFSRDFLEEMRKVDDLDWTMLCPALAFQPGKRTGRFRLETNALLTAADGTSSISFEDFSIAMLDEVEQPKHLKSRFSVGY